MNSNFDIFDFSLGRDEMDTITGLGRGELGRTGPNPCRCVSCSPGGCPSAPPDNVVAQQESP